MIVQKLLGAGNVDHMEKLHLSLTRKMADDACNWVTDDKSFEDWRTTTSGQALALFGVMGCGKTITMTYMINHVRCRFKEMDDAVICYHYCRDDETGNSLYIYSSLIQQLMIQNPRFKIQFHEWYQERQQERNWGAHQDPQFLGKFFFDSVKSLKRPVFVFLDGLDECDQSSCEEILTSFKRHSPSLPGLRLCISARFQAEIRSLLDGSFEMRIPTDPKRDHAIASHMVNGLASLNKEGMEDSKAFVIGKLTELANGSAIWIQMAVDLLAKRKITAHARLQAFLRDELPGSQLSDMYTKLFIQVSDSDADNENILSDTLEIMATAERPLSVLELGWAVALRDTEAEVTTVEGLKDYVDTERLLGLLSPFVSILNSKGDETPGVKRQSVHLVHQSLRELVLQSPPRSWAQRQPFSDSIATKTIPERRSELHGKFVRDCVRYFFMEDIENRQLLSEEQDLAQTLDGMPGMDVFDDDSDIDVSSPKDEPQNIPEPSFDPFENGFGGFFIYASCYWLHHLRKVERRHGPDLETVVSLSTAGTRRSDNWWEQFHRPECTFRPDESQARPTMLDPFTILSLYGQESLLQDLLRDCDQDSILVQDQQKHAVIAILRMGDLNRLPILIQLKPGEDLYHCVRLFEEVLHHWSQHHLNLSPESQKRFDVIFDHMAGMADAMVEQQWGNSILCRASSFGCIPFLERLFSAAARNPLLKREILRTPHRSEGSSLFYHQSVGDAAWNHQGAAVAFLLEQDGIKAHLQYRDAINNNVIHKCIRGHAEVETLKLLLFHLPEGVNERNGEDDMPLQLLVFNVESGGDLRAKMLLDAGADVRCGYTGELSNYSEPLRMATRYCDLAMCQTLIEVGGADPKSVFRRDVEGWQFLDPLINEDRAADIRQNFLHGFKKGVVHLSSLTKSGEGLHR